jgi:DNA-binding beta-propeller fold protein YncE
MHKISGITFFLVSCLLSLAAQVSVITNLAGTGVKGFSGDGGLATEAQLNGPTGIARGPDGALYVCDTGNHRIRKISSDGKITTIAGTGMPGWSGDGGSPGAAQLNEPYEVRFDADGNVFWVERLSHSVRRCDRKTGIISTVAGTGTGGFSGDGGLAVHAQLNEPHSIGFDKAGALYICDVKNHRIRKVDLKTGIISTFAGTGDKKRTPDAAQFSIAPLYGPRALDFDAAGNLWLALREGNAVYELDLSSGTIQHRAGTGKKGFTGNGGPALAATLSGPKGLAVGPGGNVYLADTESHSIRMLAFIASASQRHSAGNIRLVAGDGDPGDGPEGNPLKCQLARPHGIFVDKDGAVFIGDTDANRIRVIRIEATR